MSKRLHKPKRIADKLFYGIILLLVLSLGGFGSLSIKRNLQGLGERARARVEATANYLEQLLPPAVEELNVRKIREIIEQTASESLQAVEIFDQDGERIYVYERTKKDGAIYDQKIEGELILNGNHIGKITSYFSLKAFMDSLKLNEFLNLILLISIAAIILGVGLYFLAKNTILKPIERTLNFSKALAEGNYEKRIDIRSNDEMGSLQYSLNQMANALQKSVQQLEVSVKEAKRAHQEASEAARLKGEFLANMSHEIRTPLHAIIGFTDLLYEDEKLPERRKNLETIQQNAKDLLEHISDILDYSKMEAGKLILVKSLFSLPTLVDEITHPIQLRLKEKKVHFHTDIAEDLKDQVKGDRTRIRQILLNLLINATKFTQEGKISLLISREPKTNQVLFKVIDTGIGISKEDQKRIFDPFTQADASFTKKYGGFGLGLSIVQRLVDLMKGKVWVESHPGKGTTFHFVAPIG